MEDDAGALSQPCLRLSTEVTPRPASVWITSPVMMRDWDEARST